MSSGGPQPSQRDSSNPASQRSFLGLALCGRFVNGNGGLPDASIFGNFASNGCLMSMESEGSCPDGPLKPETAKIVRQFGSKGGTTWRSARTSHVAAMVVMLLAAVSAQATSHVRIVRLSYEDGSVQMERTASQGLERAILNSPIVEGTRIVTGDDGLAEVEFENNSTVRLGEATDVKFRQLLINDSGELVNEVELVRGTMYFDTQSGKNNVYRVIAAGSTFVVQRNSQARFMMSGDQVQVAVLNGEIRLQDNAEGVKIKKKDTLTVDSDESCGVHPRQRDR